MRCTGSDGKRAHHLIDQDGTGVDRYVDDAWRKVSDRVVGGQRLGIPARYSRSDIVISRASTADFPDPASDNPHVTGRGRCRGHPGDQL